MLAWLVSASAASTLPVVESGRTVAIEFTIALDDGSIAASNVGGVPLVFRHGAHEVLPAVEAELTGLRANDSKQFTLSPEDGFGPVDPAARMEVDPELVPVDSRKVGAVLLGQDPSGASRRIRVHAVGDAKIVVDYNHPLAGETLHFKVRVISVE